MESAHVVSDQFERMRATAEDERVRTSETMRAIYDQSTGESHALLREATDRFAEVMAGMKQMSGEMQRELEATRTELRRGILELPQETAESAAQMRRVLVDQIEALAELNRIVARHGRNLDAAEPARRMEREEPALAIVGGRAEAPPRQIDRQPTRADVGAFAPPARPRPEAPALSPAQTAAGRGWLTDLLSRASREEGEPMREAARPPAPPPAPVTARR